MKDQHTKITGYRDLSQAEIDLMNRIKAHAAKSEELLREVDAHLTEQQVTANNMVPHEYDTECKRIARAEPRRWLAIAKTDLQTANMALVRAVAQPSTF